MDSQQAIKTIREMENYAKDREVGLLLAGSAGYRSVLLHPDQFSVCDDLDCIFVYETIDAMEHCPYIDESFFGIAKEAVEKDCDMFSTKIVRNQIRLSLDFISISYLEKLSKEAICGQPVYRIKLTDAVEKDYNSYCDFFGKKIAYHKPCMAYKSYRLYTLPIYLYSHGDFFPGVLLNKFLYNPSSLCSIQNQESYIRRIQERIRSACPLNGTVENTCYKKQAFSEETRKFLEAKG